MNDIRLNDQLNNKDTISFEAPQKSGFRTKIVAGYDPYKDKHGVTRFGETVFETENMIVLGGSLFTLEKLFGVVSPLKVEYLNDIMGIATTGEEITDIYPKDTVVCLFGVGTGGAGDAITEVKDVKYYEREIVDMIPLRQTADPLTAAESKKYWFKRDIEINGIQKRQYFLKTFETEPEIKVLWRDGEGDEDGSEVGDNVHNTPETNNTPIETFIEITMNINKKDIREYFEDMGNVEVARLNSIALFTGIKSKISETEEDFKQVKMFSKLNINNEVMTLAKDLTIAYRIYTS